MSTREAPPQVIGYRVASFVLGLTGDDGKFYCGADAPQAEFPTMREPIWRDEVPEGACCETCGLALAEL